MEAFGLAAGTIQVFDFSVKAVLATIKVLQALQDSPKHIAELLQDADKSIARLLDLKQRLQHPNDPLVQTLSAIRLQELQVVASDGYDAIHELHDTLSRLQVIGTDSWRKKKWKAVVSVHAGEDIERNLKRIQMTLGELHRELQLADLEINTGQSKKITQLCPVIDEARLEAQSANTRIQSLATATRAHEVATSSRLDQLKLQTESIGTRISEEQAVARSNIEHQTVATITRLDSLSQHGQSIQNGVSGVHETVNSVRDELRSFRDEILRAITGEINSRSIENQATAGRLTEQENTSLNRQVKDALVTHPQAFKQACDVWIPCQNSTAARLTPVRDPNACSCGRRKPKRWSAYKGIFGVQYESLETHEPHCILHAIDKRSWRYSLLVQILPFLHKTIELTAGATFQGGGFEMTPPLRVWYTVKRSESSMFRLFDNFPDICCLRLIPGGYGSRHIKFRQQEGWVLGEWDWGCVDLELSRMHKEIRTMASTSICPWRIRDEYGNTLLHVGNDIYSIQIIAKLSQEVIHLIQSISNGNIGHIKNLGPLLTLAAEGGIHLTCEAAAGFRKYNAETMFTSKG